MGALVPRVSVCGKWGGGTGLGTALPSLTKQKRPVSGRETPTPAALRSVSYFSSASMILLKVADGRMTAEVFSSSGQ